MTTYRPNHRVTLRRVANGRRPEDISRDVASIQTHKRYGDIGSFDLLTTYARRDKLTYDQYVKPGDLLLIELDEGARKGCVPVMLGIVAAVERHTFTDNHGTPRRSVHISGQDFGRLLTLHHCLWSAAIRKDNEGATSTMIELVYGASLYTGGTPAEIARTIINEEMFNQMPWTKDYLDTSYMESDDGWTRPLVPLSTQDTVWGALRNISNPPYNTLHADTGDDGRFYIYIEKCPFDDTTGRLTLEADLWHPIAAADVIREQIGVNDHDRITYFFNRVTCGMFGEPNSPVLYVKGDNIRENPTDKIDYGFRPWLISTDFVPLLAEGPPTPPHLQNTGAVSREPVWERTDALWNWHKDNHTLESGILETHGKPHIRTGEGIIYGLNGFEYFTEQITHTYSVNPVPVFRTITHVTRGQRHAT